ncbi:hypothetical protein HMPREF0766_11480 [Sphingobacterium spiritivorum ATCC 33861]|uniref:Uncharacterized protein n=1 Tax=Sphingobacterium spiritivorum ATCC 33861 TaxID=525373 RepID=D7VKG1_SPHSI|nr:hypothetical protein HMPREF0766_11480 [Sphingobacterium spiritivorum ATCC 33861]
MDKDAVLIHIPQKNISIFSKYFFSICRGHRERGVYALGCVVKVWKQWEGCYKKRELVLAPSVDSYCCFADSFTLQQAPLEHPQPPLDEPFILRYRKITAAIKTTAIILYCIISFVIIVYFKS